MSDRLLEQLSSLDTSLQRLCMPLRGLMDEQRFSACTRLMMRCQGAIVARDLRVAADTMPEIPESLLTEIADAAGKAAVAGTRFDESLADLALLLSNAALARAEAILAAPQTV